MSRPRSLRDFMELAGTVAVVLSLIYVGIQVRQNTLAIQTATSQGAYDYLRETNQEVIANRELAELLVRANDPQQQLDAADSLRVSFRRNLRVDLFEFVYTSARLGTMEQEMAGGWLRGLPDLACEDGFAGWWGEEGDEYHPDFIQAIDSIQVEFCA